MRVDMDNLKGRALVGDVTVGDIEALEAEIDHYRSWVGRLLKAIEEQWYDERFGAGAYAEALHRAENMRRDGVPSEAVLGVVRDGRAADGMPDLSDSEIDG